MKTYNIFVTETVIKMYTVKAETEEDARDMYYSGDMDYTKYKDLDGQCDVDTIEEVTD